MLRTVDGMAPIDEVGGGHRAGAGRMPRSGPAPAESGARPTGRASLPNAAKKAGRARQRRAKGTAKPAKRG